MDEKWEAELAATVFNQGLGAFKAGMTLKNNPYVDYLLYEKYRVEFYDYWRLGWLQGLGMSRV